MKIIMSLIILVVSFHSFAKNEKFKNHDSVYYNSIGGGLIFGGAGSEQNNVDLAGFGFDFSTNYLMSESVFSSVEIRHASSLVDRYSSNTDWNSNMQAYNAQLGIKKSNKILDPFVLGEVKLNYYNESSYQETLQINWQELNTHIGFKAKIKLFDALRGAVSASYIIGANNISSELRLNQGYNIDLEVILLTKLKVYLDFEARYSDYDVKEQAGYNEEFISFGLNYVH